MVDIILGMGEVGQTIFELLVQRNFKCIGIDVDPLKCRNYDQDKKIEEVEYLHVCIPGTLIDFDKIISKRIESTENLNAVIIHSTVKPRTTEIIQKQFDIPILFSPVRGVHSRFLEDVKRYTKFVANDRKISSKIVLDFEKRFQKVKWMSTTKTAEFAKILVDTTYYGWLINYAQITKMICEKEGIDFEEMWSFADEIHENLGNRPKMYPGIIGGHCVIPNLELIANEKIDIIREINEKFAKFKAQNF